MKHTPKRVEWRQLVADESPVWVPWGTGWTAGHIVGLGKNRAERTVVHIRMDNGHTGDRYAYQLYWRDPRLKGRDKPEVGAIGHLTKDFHASEVRA